MVVQRLKHLPAMRETWVQSLGWEDPQGKGNGWLLIHFMANEETMETVTDFVLGSSRITANGGCRHEIKRRLLLGRKGMTNLYSILKSRDITSLTKVHLVKAMVFPVVMYRCESWTLKKAEHRRIDAFYPWCWRRLLRVLWIARRSTQSVLRK